MFRSRISRIINEKKEKEEEESQEKKLRTNNKSLIYETCFLIIKNFRDEGYLYYRKKQRTPQNFK